MEGNTSDRTIKRWIKVIQRADVKSVKKLVAKKDVNVQDDSGNTPLHWAVRQLAMAAECEDIAAFMDHGFGNAQTSIVELIQDLKAIIFCLAEKADVSIRNISRRQPLQMMLRDYYQVLCESIGTCNMFDDNLSDVMTCLITQDALEEPIQYVVSTRHNNRIKHRTSSDWICYPFLHTHITLGNHQFVEALVKKGIDVSRSAANKVTALHELARSRGSKAPVSLVSSLAAEGLQNAQDERGLTPLHAALITGYKPYITELLGLNADASIRDKTGLTPVERYCYTDSISFSPDVVMEILCYDHTTTEFLFLNALQHALVNILNRSSLEKLLKHLFARMPTFQLHILEIKQGDQLHDNEKCVKLTVGTNDRKLSQKMSLRMLHAWTGVFIQLPCCITGVPDSLYSPLKCTDPVIADRVQDIDDMWYRYTTEVLPISRLCVQVILKSIAPVTQKKIDKLPLPFGLKDKVRQADRAYDVFNVIDDFQENNSIFAKNNYDYYNQTSHWEALDQANQTIY